MELYYIVIDGRFDRRKTFVFNEKEMKRYINNIDEKVVHTDMYIKVINKRLYNYYNRLEEYKLNSISIKDLKLDIELMNY